ncbi:hypothetical protein RFI_29596 [Reticulomyxa filosa]|uniref:Uncharacterized protein n=1 Tax=Reticulomyxa filosa TaxID=46433 RepID=X6M1M9_RETFI|nr:hypothetical protein RFI_29596 [Reticulomyxa filosa]|eukprot:ETO07794.1 hypothetical protein RFI_29596 [Reticulomyxa filosa]
MKKGKENLSKTFFKEFFRLDGRSVIEIKAHIRHKNPMNYYIERCASGNGNSLHEVWIADCQVVTIYVAINDSNNDSSDLNRIWIILLRLKKKKTTAGPCLVFKEYNQVPPAHLSHQITFIVKKFLNILNVKESRKYPDKFNLVSLVSLKKLTTRTNDFYYLELVAKKKFTPKEPLYSGKKDLERIRITKGTRRRQRQRLERKEKEDEEVGPESSAANEQKWQTSRKSKQYYENANSNESGNSINLHRDGATVQV